MVTARRVLALCVCLCATPAVATAQAPADEAFTVAGADVLPFEGVALSLNEFGEVVGRDAAFHAFLWTPELGRIDLEAPGDGWLCEAAAVNNRGEVAGRCWDGRQTRAILWTPAAEGDGYVPRDLGRGMAMAINDGGEVAGGGEVTDTLQEAWRWASGRREPLGVQGTQSMAAGINQRGHIVVSGPSPESLHIGIWRAGLGIEDLGVLGIGFDINNRDDVSTNAAWTWNPSLIRAGESAVDIQMPPGMYGAARAVNDMRLVAGTATDNASELQYAFLWTEAGGYTRIGDAGSTATDVNQLGDIAGSIREADGVVHPAIWHVDTPLGVRVAALASVVDALASARTMKHGVARRLTKGLDAVNDALAGGSAATVQRAVERLSREIAMLLRRGHLPAYDAWFLRAIER